MPIKEIYFTGKKNGKSNYLFRDDMKKCFSDDHDKV
jgi:hypothetical protein